MRLVEFQSAAVDHIVARLKDRRGSRRFLLADEVGLGKTIVARGAIDRLAKARRHSLRVIYLCSNSEIAEQNRSKLEDGGGTSISRATELALLRAKSHDEVELYAFTPGTSLGRGTGMAWERRLMLFLIGRLWNIDVSDTNWRNYFRCTAGLNKWLKCTLPDRLDSEFSYHTHVSFQQALRQELMRNDGAGSLISVIANEVDTFDESSPSCRSVRNHLVSKFRGKMQRVALRALQPDLVVLDEVQRFKDVIDEANNEERISSELFREGVPVLILSATPYRLLTLEHEAHELGSTHHDDFFRTLDFLFDRDSATPARIRRNLSEFGQRIRNVDLSSTRDSKLVSLKRAIETDLRQVLCRTERNWYFLDAKLGGSERGSKELDLPNREELGEFFDIYQGLSRHLDGVGQVTDFWKSAPALLTFMDAGYALTRKLRSARTPVPRRLLSRAGDLSLFRRNLRLRRLIDHSLGSSEKLPMLWTRPTYTYYRDETYGECAPRKMLVFSGWRFVPKAIAIVVSNAAAARVQVRGEERRQPLRFTEKWSFHVFDVCFPSWAMASIVNPRATLPGTAQGNASAEDMLESALRTLRTRLVSVGVRISKTGSDPVWRAVARLEANSGNSDVLVAALHKWTDPEDVTTNFTERHRKQILHWLHDRTSEISISESDLKRLALIAVASPATVLLRALLSVFGEAHVAESMSELLALCFGELRAYFNRPIVQQVVRRHLPRVVRRKRRGRAKRGFAERVLSYALDHHLQSVLDEHTFLLRHAAGSPTVQKALKHYRAIWSLGRGSRRTNSSAGRGERVHFGEESEVWPTHFALAFGEDAAAEADPTAQAEDRLRRTEVREAFNSPFWPFVLATTSVGQEGLDFHLHCRDVFHWNLPSNPVDLEQREGRINRRDCLAVRQSISRDWPLESVAAELNSPNANVWGAIFGLLDTDNTAQRYRHGLYPHWIYECRNSSHTVCIERHVAFYEASRDLQRYNSLKSRLALYRLVFGQANQEHILNDLEERLEKLPPNERRMVQQRLSTYMLNLSPIGSAQAMKLANDEAHQLLASADITGLLKLAEDVKQILVNHKLELIAASQAIHTLLTRVQRAIEAGDLNRHGVRKAVTALAYLRNPYDQFFDARSAGGFDDDIKILRKAANDHNATAFPRR